MSITALEIKADITLNYVLKDNNNHNFTTSILPNFITSRLTITVKYKH